MKRNSFLQLAILVFIIFSTISCEEKVEWQTHESGLKYSFITNSELGSPVKLGDVLILKMKYMNENDSVLFDTREVSGPYRMQFNKPSHKGGCVEDAFSLLNVGDSMNFKVNAKLFYEKTRHMTIPKGINPESDLLFEIRLSGIQTMTDIEKERRAFRTRNAYEEQKILENYLRISNIEIEPTMSGLYYVETKKGMGAMAIPGKKVKVHYTGKFIDGEIFDSSLKRNKAFEFVLGKSEVIQGWDEGIAKMNVGGKAMLIIPSMLAYGDKHVGPIPPYSSLVFEIELLDVY